MAESGGPTTQSGIHFQNTYAALRLGRMLDATPRLRSARVVEVRVEAPTHVDDVVLTYEDGHIVYVQLKEAVAFRSNAWNKMWSDFDAQRSSDSFKAVDRLVLVLGEYTPTYDALKDAAERAYGCTDAAEWQGRLTVEGRKLVDNVAAQLNPEHPSLLQVWSLFQVLVVEHFPVLRVKEDLLPIWIPDSSVPH